VLVGRRYIVKGRVQRVGFRFFVEDAAQREGIQGYVRNQHDGSVEIVAEGDMEAFATVRDGRAARAVRCSRRRCRHNRGGAVEPLCRVSRDGITNMEALKSKIRSVPDFPKAGILFYDITTLLRDREGFKMTIEALARPFDGLKIDLVVGVESRGFILGGAVADRLGAGFAPVRKKGKLPSKTVQETYDLEYGTDCLEIHADAVERGQRVLIVDDVARDGRDGGGDDSSRTQAWGRRPGARVPGRAGVSERPSRRSRTRRCTASSNTPHDRDRRRRSARVCALAHR
jgi:adenine phosphoribosyltransferase